MTITTTPLPHSNWQYWHTMHVPMDGGVYSVQVYAPALPRITAEAFVEIGTPPVLHPVPEPGAMELVALCLLLVALTASFPWRMRAWWTRWMVRRKILKAKKALEESR